jgi:hypothetical protein
MQPWRLATPAARPPGCLRGGGWLPLTSRRIGRPIQGSWFPGCALPMGFVLRRFESAFRSDQKE